jgi:GTP-binding protein Era
MNRVLLQTARQAADSADLLLVVLDAALYAGTPDRLEKDLKPLEAAIAAETRPVLTALNKVDLLGDKSRLLPLLQCLAELWPRAELFPLSSLTRVGMPELLAHIKALLPEAPAQFPPDQLSTLSVRVMAAEIIREKLFLSLRRELPYSTAVDIEDWHEEHDKNLTVINALIYVGRATHKAMVIGKGGRNLKSVGQAARKEITELLGNRVHLELWVKTQENWPEDSGFLHALGLGR